MPAMLPGTIPMAPRPGTESNPGRLHPKRCDVGAARAADVPPVKPAPPPTPQPFATTTADSSPATVPPVAAVAALEAGGILAEITSGLADGSDLQELLARFMPPLVDLARADAGAIRVLDEDGQRMVLVASQGLPEEVRRSEGEVAGRCGICGRAAQGDTPLWDDDLGDCGRRHGGRYFGSGCRRLLAVPLTHRGRTLGVCNLFYGEGHEPPPGAMPLLGSVGALLGLALAHARLERENLRATVLHERQAMAADVHDSIGQSLAFVKMRLPLLHDAIRGGNAADAGRYFDDVREAVGQAHASLRGVLAQFRTPPDPMGLAHALEVSATILREACPTNLALRNELPAGLLSPTEQHQVAQVVQEALLNVVRHARADRAWVRLGRAAAPGEGLDAIEVLVEDDGVGPPAHHGVASTPGARFDAAARVAPVASESHYGLHIMRERARRLGGELSIGPREGGGTRVRLVFTAASARRAPAAPAATRPAIAPVASAAAPARGGQELH